MTSLNINISQESVVKLALAANEKDVTLKRYIGDLIDAHAERLTNSNNHKASTTNAPPAVEVQEPDLDEVKKQAKESSTKQPNKKTNSTPLYGKKESNSWKIW